jgi:hypothetical protein
MLLFAGVMLAFAPCTFAAPESAASPAVAVEQGVPSETMTGAERAALDGEVGVPAPDLSLGDVDEEFSPPPPRDQRITLAERLTLQNAVCALWANGMKQEPAPVESIDLMNAEAPDHIFIDPPSGFYYDNGEWVFEGLIRQMAPDSTGIECIGGIQSFHVVFKKEADGRFAVVSIHFGDLGVG